MWTRKRKKRWRMSTNTEIQGVLQREDIVNFMKSLRLRLDCHVEKMSNQRIAKQIVTSAVERTRIEDDVKDGDKRSVGT
jgi:hypothetical protein